MRPGKDARIPSLTENATQPADPRVEQRWTGATASREQRPAAPPICLIESQTRGYLHRAARESPPRGGKRARRGPARREGDTLLARRERPRGRVGRTTMCRTREGRARGS